MPSLFGAPILSSAEIVSIRRVLESRLTDTCFLTTFSDTNYIYRMLGRYGVSLWDGDTTRDSIISDSSSYYQCYSASWGSAIPCRVVSQGTGSKLVNNSTVFTTNIEIELARGVALTPPKSAPLEPVADSSFVYDQYLFVGTWIAYNNEVYRITGINKPDTVPTVQRVTAELDDSTESGVTVRSTGTTAIKGYSTVGAAIRAVASIPSVGRYLVTDSGNRLSLALGGNLITKGV